MRFVRTGMLLLSLVAAGVAGADQTTAPAVGDVSVHARGGWLHADLSLRNLIDLRTASTIDSGLSGVCAYEVAVLDPGGHVVGRRVWTYTLQHDLWEDRYVVRGPEGELALPSLAAMDSVCSNLENVRLAPLSRLTADTEYRLAVTVEVLPLGAEDQDRLSRYVSRRGDRNREDVDLDLGSLFGRLFGGGRPSTTTIAHTGPTFRLRALERRP